ncbi:putative E3 ubiquitin-protein ligase BRE1 [Blattamonas nauphoetae]|uniref:E3 ubiquitin protein ligase n=1 Tax=Blattamonas nauphoetae TaxID=2049346 RepID=A0ABQ9YG03_9EUKA|nr:putative E3 ubiquitin-protein ligase BRE1 [Blattamonas nauphoetae]
MTSADAIDLNLLKEQNSRLAADWTIKKQEVQQSQKTITQLQTKINSLQSVISFQHNTLHYIQSSFQSLLQSIPGAAKNQSLADFPTIPLEKILSDTPDEQENVSNTRSLLANQRSELHTILQQLATFCTRIDQPTSMGDSHSTPQPLSQQLSHLFSTIESHVTLKSQLDSSLEQLREFEADKANLELQVHNLKRRAEMQPPKVSSPAPSPSPAPQKPSLPNHSQPSSPSQSPGPSGTDTNQPAQAARSNTEQLELDEMKAVLVTKDRQIEKLLNEKGKLQEQVSNLKAMEPVDEVIKKTKLYQALKTQFAQLTMERKQADEELQRQSKQIESLTHTFNHYKTSTANQIAHEQTTFTQKLVESEKIIGQLREKVQNLFEMIDLMKRGLSIAEHEKKLMSRAQRQALSQKKSEKEPDKEPGYVHILHVKINEQKERVKQLQNANDSLRTITWTLLTMLRNPLSEDLKEEQEVFEEGEVPEHPGETREDRMERTLIEIEKLENQVRAQQTLELKKEEAQWEFGRSQRLTPTQTQSPDDMDISVSPFEKVSMTEPLARRRSDSIDYSSQRGEKMMKTDETMLNQRSGSLAQPLNTPLPLPPSLTTAIHSYVSEMSREKRRSFEELSEQYAELEAKMAGFVSTATQKEEMYDKALKDQVKNNHRFNTLEETRQLLKEKCAHQAKLLEEKNEILAQLEEERKEEEERVKSLSSELTKMSELAQKSQVYMNDQEQKLSSLTDSMALKAAQVTELQQQLTLEREAKLRMEKEKVNTESEAMVLRQRLGGDPVDGSELAQKLDMYKKLLDCSVCHVRPKNVLITKCFHMFCKECIHDVIQSRSRKCPQCGEKFAQEEARTFYF